MVIVMVWAVAVGIDAADLPAVELRALAKQVALPAGAAEKWDAIGTYTIKSGKAATTVKLYYADSDSIAAKEKRRSGIEGSFYPNFFSIHAVYRDGDGPWKHRKLYGVARAGFWKVAEIKPDSVTIQVRSKMILFSDSAIRFTDEDLERIYKPVPMRLTLKNGVPVLN